MKKFTTKKLLLVSFAVLAVFMLAGCQRNVDENGVVLAEKIIYLTTSWGDIFKTDGLFTTVFVYPLSQCINFLSQYVGVALAIAFTTLIVNMITLSFSVKSTVDMQKIQNLQPELNRIQKKYEGRNDDNSKLQQAQEMQKLYEKHNVNPFGSMLTPFLQLPIMLAMYYSVQRSAAVVSGTIFGASLSNTPMYGLRNGEIILFVIFILMGVAQFASSKLPTYLAEKKNERKRKAYAKQDDNKQSTNTMVYAMLVMILVLAINWPTAMSLYWLVSSTINVVKTLYVQKRYIDHE
ncbi:MAG: YidC/Oxa1 family membrane protein insertase [Bacilli bacterium]|nr:YidC/Oxa1 family membrane protein insertase [Bacilli bacterium]